MTNPTEIGSDLSVIRVEKAFNSTWIIGTVHGHRFAAKIYPLHALDPKWELGESRISKLFVRRQEDCHIAFAWDRGLIDVGKDPIGKEQETKALVAFLTSGSLQKFEIFPAPELLKNQEQENKADEFAIRSTEKRGAEVEIIGTFRQHLFSATVRAAHASPTAQWELGDSQLSELRVRRLLDNRVVFEWDKGKVNLEKDLQQREKTKPIVFYLASGVILENDHVRELLGLPAHQHGRASHGPHSENQDGRERRHQNHQVDRSRDISLIHER